MDHYWQAHIDVNKRGGLDVGFADAQRQGNRAWQPLYAKIDHPRMHQGQERLFQENLAKIEKIEKMTRLMLREHPNSQLLLKYDQIIKRNHARIDWMRKNWHATPEKARQPLRDLAADTVAQLKVNLRTYRRSGAYGTMNEILNPPHRLRLK